MTYRAIWLDNFDEIGCDTFDDLIHAREFVLEHFASYQSKFGINRVRVCDDKITYFSLERAHDGRKFSPTSDQPEQSHRFNPGINVKIVANDGHETHARVDWPRNDDEPGGTDERKALLEWCLDIRIDPSSGDVVRRQRHARCG